MKLFSQFLVIAFAFATIEGFGVGPFFLKKLGRINRNKVLHRNYTIVRDSTVTQPLDHFNSTEKRTWQQQYYYRDEWTSEARDIAFLELGGEGAEDGSSLEAGSWLDIARENKAILFDLEHRYYGRSRPTEDLSTENLQYLSSRQAVADIATFIEQANRIHNLSAEVKWVVFGGSYAGCLAAWARLKYPDLVYGAMSASGPVKAELNFKEYMQVVYEDYRGVGESCSANIQAGFEQLANAMEKGDTPETNITELFHLSRPFNMSKYSSLDLGKFYEALTSIFASSAQYASEYPYGMVKALCNIMTSHKGTPLERLAKVSVTMGSGATSISYEESINSFKEIRWDHPSSNLGRRQWVYQCCTEFGFYQTTDGVQQEFGDKVILELFTQRCRDLFGEQFTDAYQAAAVDNTNAYYQSSDLDLIVSNVVFVHGSVDPWKALGITETRNEKAPAIVIEGASHCQSMDRPVADEVPGLQPAREQIRRMINAWLQQK